MSDIPSEVVEPVGRFLNRRDAQSFTDVNRTLSCNTNCPAGHKCYPAADGCTVGRKRPGREHCCEFDVTTHVHFVRVVGSMQRLAAYKMGTPNQGPASQEYVQDLGAIVPANTPQSSPPTFMEINNRIHRCVDVNLTFANYPGPQNLPDAIQLDVISLGSKLFLGMHVRLVDNVQLIGMIERSIRNNPDFFFTSTHHEQHFHVPDNLLSLARNISIHRMGFTHLPQVLSEQQLFDMLRQKLIDADDARFRGNINMTYSNAGQTSFDPIKEACSGSRFKGLITCRLDEETVGNVILGTFDGIDISLGDSLDHVTPAGPHEFDNMYGFCKVLRISR